MEINAVDNRRLQERTHVEVHRARTRVIPALRALLPSTWRFESNHTLQRLGRQALLSAKQACVLRHCAREAMSQTERIQAADLPAQRGAEAVGVGEHVASKRERGAGQAEGHVAEVADHNQADQVDQVGGGGDAQGAARPPCAAH